VLSETTEGQRKVGGVGLAFAVVAETREAKNESNVEEGERIDEGDEDCFFRRRLRRSVVEQELGSDRDDNGGQAIQVIQVTRVPRKSWNIHWKGVNEARWC
jgi:hypothetical protein